MNEAFYRRLDRLYASEPRSVEAFLHKAQEACLRERDQEGIIAVRNELGSLYRGQGRYEESLQCFQDALSRMEQLGRKDGVPYLTARVNRAGTLRLAGRAEEAVEEFLQVLSSLREAPEAADYLQASALNNLGLAYQSLDRLEEAADCAEKALAILKALPGMEAETVSSGINLASLCLRQGRLEEAERWLGPALAYYQSPAGRQDPHFPNACAALGALRSRQDRLEEALECYDQSAAGTERFFGRTPQYAAARYDAALMSFALKREDCGARLEEAAALWERLRGPESPRVKTAHQLLERLREDAP